MRKPGEELLRLAGPNNGPTEEQLWQEQRARLRYRRTVEAIVALGLVASSFAPSSSIDYAPVPVIDASANLPEQPAD